MELFSVTCITCRAKLKVRHASAIGQILPCPRCNGMVQIEPPAGWKPPVPAETAPVVAAAKVQGPPPVHPPLMAALADDPIVPPSHAAPPGETRVRRWILAGGIAVAAVIVGFGLWSTFGGGAGDEPIAAVPGPEVTGATPTASVPRPSPTSPAAASPTASAAPSATVKPPAVGPTAIATVIASATPRAVTPSATAAPRATLPVPHPSPSAANPPPTAVASATPSATIPTATPTATKPPAVAMPAVVAPSLPPLKIDLAARLHDKFPELTFDNTPLHQALAILSQLSTIRINYDWDSPAVAAAIRHPITVKLGDAAIADAMAKVLAPFDLTTTTIGDQLLVIAADPVVGVYAAEYAVDDLVGTGGTPPERLVQLVEDFVAPESWRSAGGEATIVAGGDKLKIVQSAAAHRETDAFLDRLRKARGRAPKNSATSLASRFTANRDVLDKPLVLNFRPGAPLETVLGRLQDMTGALFTVDYPALMSAGYEGTEPIGAAADKHPLADVLTALCSPREWSWRIVGERAVELTTREGMRRRPFVEFYKVPQSMATPAAAQALIGRIRNQLVDEGWRGLGGRGEITFDEPSAMILVRQHQEAQIRLERALTALARLESGDVDAKPPAAAPTPSPTATPSPAALPTTNAAVVPPATR